MDCDVPDPPQLLAVPPSKAEPLPLDYSPEGLDEVEVGELMAVHEGLEDLQVDGVPGKGAEGRVGCSEELPGTRLPERVEVREGEGIAIPLPDPATVCSAHVSITHVVPFSHVHALPPMSRPPAPHGSPAQFSPRRRVWLWSGLP